MVRETGNLRIHPDSLTARTCPACHVNVLAGTHTRHGTTVYLNPTALPPYSTADLHSPHCRQPEHLKRYIAADTHASFTGTKWQPA